MKHNIGTIKEEGKVYTITLDVEIRKDGELSISGDIARNDRDFISCGQCNEEIGAHMQNDAIEYRAGWSREKLAKVLDIWDKWHLNHMHPECEHQEAQGWRELAGEYVTIYGFKLDRDVSKLQRDIEEKVLNSIKSKGLARVTEEEKNILNLEYSLRSLEKDAPEYYVSCASDSYWGDKSERRGFIRYDEHPEVGLLCKPCNVCDYKYGTAWTRRVLPDEVIQFVCELNNS